MFHKSLLPWPKSKPAYRSIPKTLRRSMTLMASVALLLLGSLWITQEYLHFREEAQQVRRAEFESRKQSIKRQVVDALDYIAFMRSQAETRLRETLKSRVYEAHSLAGRLYQTYRNEKPLHEIQAMVREALRSIRFNNGRGYFFATDMESVLQLCSGHPECEGGALSKEPHAPQSNVIAEVIDIAKTKGEGFCSQLCAKPQAPGKDHRKISFFKSFAPFDWIIGAGEYLDDMESEIQREVLERIATIRIGDNGYVFAGRWDGLSLSGPRTGQNVWDIVDPNGVKIVQELIAQAKAGGGYVHYVMPADDGQRAEPKISYARGVPEWQWYVGTGVYLGDIEKTYTSAMRKLRKQLAGNVLKGLMVLAALILVARRLSGLTANRFGQAFSAFTEFVRQAGTESHQVALDSLQFPEFRDLAGVVNEMLEKINTKQRALNEKTEELERFFTLSLDLLCIVDTDGYFRRVNQAWEDILGFHIAELENRRFMEFVHPEDVPATEQTLRDLLQGRSVIDFVNRYHCKDGSLRWIEWRSIPYGDKLIYAAARDITARKLAEESLRENEERYRLLVENANDAIFIAQDQALKFPNCRTSEITGYSFEELTQIPFADFIHPADRDMVVDRYRRRLAGEKVPSTYSFRLVGKSGRELWVQLNAVQIAWEGRPASLNFLRDITDQRKLEDQLRQAQKMEAIGTLAGGIAHDFNNILSAIIGYAELTRTCDLPEKSPVREGLSQILQAGRRAKDLVKQILAFSRQIDQERIPIRLTPIVKEALKFLRASLPATIEIRRRIEPEMGVVLADPTQMHQIVMNLCTNASHAMELRGGTLTVKIQCIQLKPEEVAEDLELRPGGYTVLTVEDTGCGMAPEVLERAFEPYFTTKETGKGTGLGLSVVHGIVKNHGGAIRVVSELDQGSAFRVYLPIVEFYEPVETEPTQALQTGSERILFVDDEASLAELGRRVLGRLGYQVQPRTSPIEALAAFQAQPDKFDLVITDLTMPNMTGDALARELMAIRPDIPVILCTGFSERMNAERARSLGIRGFILKPLIMSELARIVRQVIEQSWLEKHPN